MTEYEKALSDHLQELLTHARREKFTEILANRTRHLTVVLVDLFQDHNASAVLRSCEAFGVQDVHIVETMYRFSTKRDIALGTDRWLTLHRYRGEEGLDQCFEDLKANGYQTAATVLQEESLSIQEVDLQNQLPLALFFGTEKEGLPAQVIERTDLRVHIPMYGFVESFNVSVAAALSLQSITDRLRDSQINWHLSPRETAELLLKWTRKTVPNSDAIERRFQETWSEETSISKLN